MQTPDLVATHAKSNMVACGYIWFDAVKRVGDVISQVATAREADLLTSEAFMSCAALSRPR